MRFTLCVAALAGLAACSPSIPDSGPGAAPDTGRGVGFDDPAKLEAQRQAREAELQGNAIPPAGAISDETPGATAQSTTGQPLSAIRQQQTQPQSGAQQPVVTAGTTYTSSGRAVTPTGGVRTAGSSDELARETEALLRETSQNSGQQVLHASPSNPPPRTVTTSTGISDENDFDAVGNVRSIDADAELIARNKAQYQVVQPTALPSRTAAGPNVVQYALSTKHQPGTQLYTRVGLNKRAKFQRNCAVYASPDLAQADFLSKGGPRRDKLGLDPDGDGFACNWDPRPFRAAVGG